jgi:hypothetical protein
MRQNRAILTALAAVTIIGSATPRVSAADSANVAVFPLRSTSSLAGEAGAFTRRIVALLNQEGTHARIVSPDADPASAAANSGADDYVVGQLTEHDSALSVVIASFETATGRLLHESHLAIGSPDALSGRTVAELLNNGTSGQTDMPARSDSSTGLLVIPFAPPGNKDDQLDYATDLFSKKLTAQGLKVLVGPAEDLLDVATDAPDLCRKFDASGVLVGTVRHEQHAQFMPMMSHPSHAEVRISRLSCSGKIVWKGLGIGDKVTVWSNPRSAETEAISNALDQVVTQLVEEPGTAQ